MNEWNDDRATTIDSQYARCRSDNGIDTYTLHDGKSEYHLVLMQHSLGACVLINRTTHERVEELSTYVSLSRRLYTRDHRNDTATMMTCAYRTHTSVCNMHAVRAYVYECADARCV